jgi:hypothetical protein
MSFIMEKMDSGFRRNDGEPVLNNVTPGLTSVTPGLTRGPFSNRGDFPQQKWIPDQVRNDRVYE